MRIETFKCDVCGVTKGETNHWWQLGIHGFQKIALLQPHGAGFTVRSAPTTNSPQNVYQAAYAELIEQWFDLCGQDCVNRKLSEVMK